MSAQQDWEKFLRKYEPGIVKQAKTAVMKLRRMVPGATEMVYDNYNALVIGFGPNERASDAVFSIALYPEHISLCFLQGAGLPDPDRLLLGSGNIARHIKLIGDKSLDSPKIQELIQVALNRAKVAIGPDQKRK